MNIADYISAFPGATDDDLISAGFAPQSVQAFRDGYMAPPSGDPSKIQPTVMPANTFGDVASQYGNEYISGGMDLAFNPNVSSYNALPQSMQGGFMEPFNREVMSILDLPLGLLSAAGGLGQKAIALGAEAIGSGTQSEERLARDWIGGVEGSGFAPEGRMLAAIADAGGIGAAGRKIVERANQPGPVPTMYSNPIAGLLGDVKAADPVAVRGAEVMDMLKSGRGPEVTDQMLDMGDPVLNARLNEYLYKNSDIPMDTASRMARANEMGFQKAFHGTGSNINAVDPAYFGSGGQDLLGAGFYTSTNTGRADRYIPRERSPGIEISKNYAEGGNILPVMVREQNPFVLEDPLGSAANDIASLYAEDPFFDVNRMSSGVNIVTDADGKSIMLDPYQQRHFALQRMRKDFSPTDASNTLSELGYTGVSGPESASSRVRVSYNPSDVRSQSARFDPRLSHLKNLSAGIGGAAVLSALGDDAEAGTQIMDLVNQSGISGAAQILGVSQRDVEEAISIAVPPSQWDQLVVGPQ